MVTECLSQRQILKCLALKEEWRVVLSELHTGQRLCSEGRVRALICGAENIYLLEGKSMTGLFNYILSFPGDMNLKCCVQPLLSPYFIISL